MASDQVGGVLGRLFPAGTGILGSNLQVAMIPARGGSKRIPHKNIREFCGRPMMSWPLDTIRETELFDEIVVSTDSEEVARVAAVCGASVPVLRASDLSGDHTPMRDVLIDTVQMVEAHYNKRVTVLCCVYATAVLLRPEDLVASRALLGSDPNRSFVFSAVTYPHPIQRALRRLPDGGVELFSPEYQFKRSQDLEEAIHDAGQFYWGRRDAILNRSSMFSPNSRAYVLPRSRAQDIDTVEDLEVAEQLFTIEHLPAR